ncbi:hypothetical protein K503DRAFT_853609 [Rhizopogon vinicolor AM-OR11-026]|uniref:TECPR1-like DysF domain-containing protein n=1 Tax=Rhizopogon vinicolor AM-OR11-026 TaxID=1314800 RepID=A0A1B7NDM6_9AGAM|nr:hypothetical protein K503DRAFT_853609 [Rhizopogon vinicolor AM-OR11-026]
MLGNTASSEPQTENSHSLASPGPPLAMMKRDDPAAVEPARRRLAPKSRFRIFSSLPNLSSCYKFKRPKQQPADSEFETHSSNQSVGQLPPLEQTNDNTTTITLDNTSISNISDNKDEYRWAVVYENQRGLTVFSSPYYSQLSLLPIDPPQFTVPSKSPKQYRQPNIVLCNYPLPDGTWHWVSKSWMIDMRTCSGEVQHDGFEYNWVFREKHWHAEVGKLSAGAWVRRRRWVRLMMRPAQHRVGHSEGSSSPSTSKSMLSGRPLNASFISLVHPQSEIALDEIAEEADIEWKGNEQDWVRCHRLMRRLGRDGRKLELWRIWLCPYLSNSDLVGKGKRPDNSSPTSLGNHGSNPPPLEHLGTLLQNHGDAILRSFVFPDSRAQLISLIKRAGLARELARSLGGGFSSAEVDFWSYSRDLEEMIKQGGVGEMT